jgi:hypothetical protein
MNPKGQYIVTLGADVGGKDAHVGTHKHVLEFRNLLRKECQGDYGSTVVEFAFVLRIDGSVQIWGKSGVDNVELQEKNTVATADIFIPRDVWDAENPTKFRGFLATEIRNAVAEISVCAHKQKISMAADQLSADIEKAIEKFLP